MFKLLRNIPNSTFLSIFLIVFFVVEAINKIQAGIWHTHFDIQKYIKLFSLVFMLGYLTLYHGKRLLYLIGITLIFCIGQFFIEEDGFSYLSIVGFSRYLLFITIVIFFSEFAQKKIPNFPIKIFHIFILINSIIIILSFLFNIELFRTYAGERFGFNGLFMTSSNTTYFYLITFLCFFNRYRREVFSKPLFWIAVTAGCLVGTKSIYLALMILFFLAILFFIRNNRTKYIFLISLFLIGSVGLYFFFSTKVFSTIVNENGWLTAILSTRNQLLVDETIPFVQKNWNVLNYLFGGLANPFLRPQLELLDLLLFFGILGGAFYIYTFAKFYFNFSIQKLFPVFTLALLFLVTLISGNFFYNATVPIYLIILKYSLLKFKK
ncbi:hypothetical protein ACFSO9_12245 [Mesonia maritima]